MEPGLIRWEEKGIQIIKVDLVILLVNVGKRSGGIKKKKTTPEVKQSNYAAFDKSESSEQAVASGSREGVA
ncbi:hypothetical protein, partial [Nodularia harveyana]|uniref:hypothetical protein n=1 Tax=Nodularia harveyana TaxID=114805 RepID=UPI002B21C7A7